MMKPDWSTECCADKDAESLLNRRDLLRARLVLNRELARGVGNSVMPRFARALAAIDAALWDAVGKALGRQRSSRKRGMCRCRLVAGGSIIERGARC